MNVITCQTAVSKSSLSPPDLHCCSHSPAIARPSLQFCRQFPFPTRHVARLSTNHLVPCSRRVLSPPPSGITQGFITCYTPVGCAPLPGGCGCDRKDVTAAVQRARDSRQRLQPEVAIYRGFNFICWPARLSSCLRCGLMTLHRRTARRAGWHYVSCRPVLRVYQMPVHYPLLRGIPAALDSYTDTNNEEQL